MQLPSKRPAYRNDRPHSDFLAEVSAVLPPSSSSPEHFCVELHRQMQSVFPEVALALPQDAGSGEVLGPGAAMTAAMFSDVHVASKDANPSFKPRTFYLNDRFE
jgi:hypothetical protein